MLQGLGPAGAVDAAGGPAGDAAADAGVDESGDPVVGAVGVLGVAAADDGVVVGVRAADVAVSALPPVHADSAATANSRPAAGATFRTPGSLIGLRMVSLSEASWRDASGTLLDAEGLCRYATATAVAPRSQ